MPEDINNPSALAALISDLRNQLANEQQVRTDTENKLAQEREAHALAVTTHASEIAKAQEDLLQQRDAGTARDQLQLKINDLSTQLFSEQTAHRSTQSKVSELTLHITDLEACLTKMRCDYQNALDKYDQLYPPIEGEYGITLGPQPFVVTADNSSHSTLEIARIHLVATTMDISPAKAREIIAKADQVALLLSHIASQTTQTAQAEIQAETQTEKGSS